MLVILARARVMTVRKKLMIANSLVLRVQLRGFRLDNNEVFFDWEVFVGVLKSRLYELRDPSTELAHEIRFA